MADMVLDASAILALLQNEPGADNVVAVIEDATISAVNLSEVMAKLVDSDVSDERVVQLIEDLPCGVAPFDGELARAAGLLRRQTISRGLSLGDRACLALAIRQGAQVLTADRAWSALDLPVEVVLIR